MAGSLKWFVYTTDAGDDYALYRDESNTEALNAGTQDYVDATTVQDAIPRNIKPRYCLMRSTDGYVSRRIVCLTPTIYNAIAAGTTVTDAVSGKSLVLTQKVGETRRYPFAPDTGLTDSDAS